MSQVIPTVLVILKASGDEIRINEARYDPALHKLVDKADAAKVQAAIEAADAEAKAEAEITAQREANSVAKRRTAAATGAPKK